MSTKFSTMKKFIIVYNFEDRRYFFHINGPFYISVSESCGIFWLEFNSDSLDSDDGLQIEICLDLDDVSSHVISLEETDFTEEAIDLIYDVTQSVIELWNDKDEKVFNADVLRILLQKKLKELAQSIAHQHPSYEAYKSHVENVPHGFGINDVVDTKKEE